MTRARLRAVIAIATRTAKKATAAMKALLQLHHRNQLRLPAKPPLLASLRRHALAQLPWAPLVGQAAARAGAKAAAAVAAKGACQGGRHGLRRWVARSSRPVQRAAVTARHRRRPVRQTPPNPLAGRAHHRCGQLRLRGRAESCKDTDAVDQ